MGLYINKSLDYVTSLPTKADFIRGFMFITSLLDTSDNKVISKAYFELVFLMTALK